MKYNFYFDIAAIMLNIMLLFNIYVRRTYPTKTCLLYKRMLWLNLASSVFDCVSALTISYPNDYPIALNYAVCGGYLLFHNLTNIVFFLYVINLVHGEETNWVERLFWKVILTYEIVIITVSPLTKWVYYFDEELNYCHGPLMLTLYAAAFAVLLYALVLFIRHRKVLNTYQMAMNITFLSLLVGTVIFQFFYPSVLMESYCAAIAFLMMNVGLDNPETYFYANTYCFNQTAFNEHVDDKLRGNEQFTLVSFTFSELKLLRKKYGEDVKRKVLFEIIRLFPDYCSKKEMYLLGEDLFTICLEKQNNVEDVIAHINDMMQVGINVDDKHLKLEPHFCVLSYPGDYRSVSDINEAVSSMLDDVYRNTGERVVYNCGDMLTRKHREAQIVQLLHQAISGDGFELYFQPIYNAKEKRYSSLEVLVRLKDTGSGPIGPDEFIPVAEENGLILRIGDIVYEKTCRFFSEHPIHSFGLDYIEVNLSKIQLLSSAAVRFLEHTAVKYGIPPRCINFEITETVGLNAGERAVLDANISHLHERGFSFSLDDFGNGYSDVSYIADSPFSLVKIDRSVLWNTEKNRRFRMVLEVALSMVHGFDMKCVAEGVETEQMASLLDSLGCDYHQGYLYAKPMPEEEFLAFMRKKQPKKPLPAKI